MPGEFLIGKYEKSPAEPVPPPGGWRKPTCTFASHLWALEIEDGAVYLVCTDRCDTRTFDPEGSTPVCLQDWLAEDFVMANIAVTVTCVDDSTPSTPAGPAEHGFYLEVRPVARDVT